MISNCFLSFSGLERNRKYKHDIRHNTTATGITISLAYQKKVNKISLAKRNRIFMKIVYIAYVIRLLVLNRILNYL